MAAAAVGQRSTKAAETPVPARKTGTRQLTGIPSTLINQPNPREREQAAPRRENCASRHVTPTKAAFANPTAENSAESEDFKASFCILENILKLGEQ
jgi:hypothetical protein